MLTRALDKPVWREDPCFRTVELRQANIDARLNLTQAALRTLSAAEWLERCRRRGRRPAGVVVRL